MDTYKWDRIIHSIVNGCRRRAAYLGADMDDLLQVGRIAALTAERTWAPEHGRSEPSWVHYMVSCEVSKHLRALGYRVTSELDDEYSHGPAEEADARLLARSALQVLRASLPEPMWAALWLRHAEGADVDDIARQFGTSNAAIRSRLTYARGRCLTILGGPV